MKRGGDGGGDDDEDCCHRPTKFRRLASAKGRARLSLANCWDMEACERIASLDRFLTSVFTDWDLSFNAELGDEEISAILGMNTQLAAPHITALNLSFTPISNSFLAALGAFAPNLRTLNLTGCSRITDHGIVALTAHCPGLTSISLAKCQGVGDLAVAALARSLPGLQLVDLTDCRPVTGKSIKFLIARCPLIKTLRLGGTSIDETTITALLSFLLLVELDLSSLPVTDAHLSLIGRNQTLLSSLTLSFCASLTPDAIEGLLAASAVLTSLKAFGLVEHVRLIEDERLVF